MRRVALLCVVVFLAAALSAQSPGFDLVIRNARIVDGAGGPWFRGDVAIRGDIIARVAASIEPPSGTPTIDAGGQVLAPGFIDIHTHARRRLFEVPTADNY